MPPKTERGRGGKGRGRGASETVTKSSTSNATVETIVTDPPVAEKEIGPAIERPQIHDSGEETDTSNLIAVSNKKKTQKLISDLSPEDEQDMVEWLQAHPIFYNKKMTSYKETAKKERMWAEKATELGKTVLVLKTWYSSMRTRYGKLRKTKSGDADKERTERDEWVIKNFDFLHPHIYEVQKKTTVSLKHKLAANCASSAISADELDDDDISTTNLPFSSSRVKPRTQKQMSETEDALLTGIEERGNKMMAFQQKVMEQLRPTSSDRERDAFVDWIRTVVNELEHNLWRRCQQDISSALYRYIAENDQLKRTQVQMVNAQSLQFQLRQPFQPQQTSSPASSAQWQPPPSQWQTQPTPNVSPWQSQDSNWLSQQLPESRQHTLTQLQLVPSVSAGQAVSPASWDCVSGRSPTVSASPTTQGETSRTSQSSFHLSDLINIAAAPGHDDTQ